MHTKLHIRAYRFKSSAVCSKHIPKKNRILIVSEPICHTHADFLFHKTATADVGDLLMSLALLLLLLVPVHKTPRTVVIMYNPQRSSTVAGSQPTTDGPLSTAATVVITSSSSNVTKRSADSNHKNSNGSAAVDDDCDVIGELMGQFGKYQFCMTFLLSLFQVPNTFHIASSIYQVSLCEDCSCCVSYVISRLDVYIFIRAIFTTKSADKDFWCKRPAHLLDTPVDVWRNQSGSADNCYRFANSTLNYAQVTTGFAFDAVKEVGLQQPEHSNSSSSIRSQSAFTTNVNAVALDGRIKCSAWEFASNDDVGNTWISEWDLVCDQHNLKSVAEMFFLAGVATGGILSGFSSDKFGRKRMLFISVVMQTIFGKFGIAPFGSPKWLDLYNFC